MLFVLGLMMCINCNSVRSVRSDSLLPITIYVVGFSPQNSTLIRCNVCSYVYVCIYFSLYIRYVHACFWYIVVQQVVHIQVLSSSLSETEFPHLHVRSLQSQWQIYTLYSVHICSWDCSLYIHICMHTKSPAGIMHN